MSPRIIVAVLALVLCGGVATAADGPDEALVEQLDRIIIPVVDFDHVHAEEAIDFLRVMAMVHDPEPDPDRRGVSILMEPRRQGAEAMEKGGGLVVERYQATKVGFRTALVDVCRRAGLAPYLCSDGIIVCQAGGKPGTEDKNGGKREVWRKLEAPN